MYKLIDKDLVAVHDGDIVFMETNPDWGGEPYRIGLVKIEGLYTRDCKLYRVNWEGIGQHGSFRMSTYGQEWRLWAVDINLPTVYETNMERWHSRQQKEGASK